MKITKLFFCGLIAAIFWSVVSCTSFSISKAHENAVIFVERDALIYKSDSRRVQLGELVNGSLRLDQRYGTKALSSPVGLGMTQLPKSQEMGLMNEGITLLKRGEALSVEKVWVGYSRAALGELTKSSNSLINAKGEPVIGFMMGTTNKVTLFFPVTEGDVAEGFKVSPNLVRFFWK